MNYNRYVTNFKLSSIIFILGAVLTGAAGIAILSLHQGFAQNLFIAFFWTEVLGAAAYFWEIRQESGQ